MDVLKARAQVQAIFHVAQYYYPESLWKLFIVNAPMVDRTFPVLSVFLRTTAAHYPKAALY